MSLAFVTEDSANVKREVLSVCFEDNGGLAA